MKTFLNVLLVLFMSICLFSVWATFALLVVNNGHQDDLPGYVIGQLCIWELVVYILCLLASFLLNKKWGGVHFDHQERKIELKVHYVWYFTFFLMFAMSVAGLQFYKFSQTF